MHLPVAVDIPLAEQALHRPALDETAQETVHPPGHGDADRERRHDTREHGDPAEEARVDAGASPPILDLRRVPVVGGDQRDEGPVRAGDEESGAAQHVHPPEERGGEDVVAGAQRVEIAHEHVRQCGLVLDIGEDGADLSDAPRLALVAFTKARGEMQAVDAEDRHTGTAGLDLAMQMRAQHAPVMTAIPPRSDSHAREDRGVHDGVRIAWLADQDLHAEAVCELANAIQLAHLLECNHIRVDTPQHVEHQLAATFPSQQDVVRGDAQRSLWCSSRSRHRQRTYNATVQPQRDAHLTELVFLDRGPLVLRCVVVAIAAAACGLAGTLLVRLHQTLAAQLAAHVALNPLQTLIATGSSVRTAWPGWVAALCFAAAVFRLRRGAPEPPAGRGSPDRLSLTQLRAGLRHEYAAVRCALVGVWLCAAVDLARTVASVIAAQSGDRNVEAAIPWTAVEAAGYVVAALVLAVWASTFGAEVRRLGAL